MKYIAILLTLCAMNVFSQKSTNLGVGVCAGQRGLVGNGTLLVSLQIRNTIELFLAGGLNTYQGLGYGYGVRIIPYNKTKLNPFVGICYSKMGQRELLYENDNNPDTYIDVPANTYYTAELGISRFFVHKDGTQYTSRYFSHSKILFAFTYRSALMHQEAKVSKGFYRGDLEYRINRNLRDGYGFYVGINFYFGRQVRGPEFYQPKEK